MRLAVSILAWLAVGHLAAQTPATGALAVQTPAAGTLAVQTPAAGTFLVATPQLRDPRFVQTVVLLLNHGSDGAIGVVVNRPTWVEPEALFGDMDFFRRYRGTVYFGGPVARTSTLFLFRDAGRTDGEAIVDDVHITADLDEMLEQRPAATDQRTLRIHAGHAGWGPGQLEREIAAGDWQVAQADGDQVFTPEPTRLWREVHRVATDMSIIARPGIQYCERCDSYMAFSPPCPTSSICQNWP